MQLVQLQSAFQHLHVLVGILDTVTVLGLMANGMLQFVPRTVHPQLDIPLLHRKGLPPVVGYVSPCLLQVVAPLHCCLGCYCSSLPFGSMCPIMGVTYEHLHIAGLLHMQPSKWVLHVRSWDIMGQHYWQHNRLASSINWCYLKFARVNHVLRLPCQGMLWIQNGNERMVGSEGRGVAHACRAQLLVNVNWSKKSEDWKGSFNGM